MDSYLKLDEGEVGIFRESLENIPQSERREVMEMTTSWKEEGRLEGRIEGLSQGLATLLRFRFGHAAVALVERLPGMELSHLQRLQAQLEAGLELEQLDV